MRILLILLAALNVGCNHQSKRYVVINETRFSDSHMLIKITRTDTVLAKDDTAAYIRGLVCQEYAFQNSLKSDRAWSDTNMSVLPLSLQVLNDSHRRILDNPPYWLKSRLEGEAYKILREERVRAAKYKPLANVAWWIRAAVLGVVVYYLSKGIVNYFRARKSYTN